MGQKYIRVIGNKNIYIGIPKEDKKKPKEKPVKTKKPLTREIGTNVLQILRMITR